MGDVVRFPGIAEEVGRENAEVVKTLVYEHSPQAFGWTALEANVIRAIAAKSDDGGEWRTLNSGEIAKEAMSPSHDVVGRAISKAALIGVIEVRDRKPGSQYFKVRFRRSALLREVGEL